jgi:hypothetical protein
MRQAQLTCLLHYKANPVSLPTPFYRCCPLLCDQSPASFGIKRTQPAPGPRACTTGLGRRVPVTHLDAPFWRPFLWVSLGPVAIKWLQCRRTHSQILPGPWTSSTECPVDFRRPPVRGQLPAVIPWILMATPWKGGALLFHFTDGETEAQRGAGLHGHTQQAFPPSQPCKQQNSKRDCSYTTGRTSWLWSSLKRRQNKGREEMTTPAGGAGKLRLRDAAAICPASERAPDFVRACRRRKSLVSAAGWAGLELCGHLPAG